MSPRQFWVLVIGIMAATIAVGVGISANRVKWWGPHTTSNDLAVPVAPGVATLNQPLPNITLVDLAGRRHNLKASRGKVVVFLVQGDRCPCSKAYVGRMNALYREYTPKGVEVWAFDPNVNETEAETRAFVKANRVQYPTAYDMDATVADMLNAACTTEVWVADKEGILRYHGRIDDNIYEPDKVKKRDLREALDAVLAGRPVPTPETQAYACTISRQKSAADKT